LYFKNSNKDSHINVSILDNIGIYFSNGETLPERNLPFLHFNLGPRFPPFLPGDPKLRPPGPEKAPPAANPAATALQLIFVDEFLHVIFV
jgi:hypothetical protein